MSLRIISIALIITLVGCTSTQTTKSDNFFSDYQAGKFTSASSKVTRTSKSKADTQHRLLWALQETSVKYWSGNIQGCLEAAERAEDMIKNYEERASVSARGVGSKLGSMLTNNNASPYQGQPSDKILLNTYKSLAYLDLGKRDAAMVEMRRASQRRQEALQKYQKAIEKAEKEAKKKNVDSNSTLQSEQYNNAIAQHYGELDKLPHYKDFANPLQVFVEAVINAQSSDPSDRQNALKLIGTLKGMSPSPTANAYENWVSQPKNGRHVHIIYEHGIAPTKVSNSINVPMTVSGRLTMVHLAFPAFTPNPSTTGQLLVSDGAREIKIDLLASMDSIQMRELKLQLPQIMVQEMLTAGLKAVMENQVSKQNPYLGLAASLLNTVTTRADTRSWSTLPKEYHFAIMPVNSNSLVLNDGVKSKSIALPEGGEDLLLHVKSLGSDIVTHAIKL